MSKNLWIAGQSGNVSGRPKGRKYSATSLKGKLDRFLKRNMTMQAMQDMYNALTASDKSKFLAAILQYTLPKQSTEGLSNEEIDSLYDQIQKLQEQVNNAGNEKRSII
jgi:hypothetical protein